VFIEEASAERYSFQGLTRRRPLYRWGMRCCRHASWTRDDRDCADALSGLVVFMLLPWAAAVGRMLGARVTDALAIYRLCGSSSLQAQTHDGLPPSY
jgi:hypothetical protein